MSSLSISYEEPLDTAVVRKRKKPQLPKINNGTNNPFNNQQRLPRKQGS